MVVKIVDGAFAASVISLSRASSKYFGERHLWPSHLQGDLVAICRRDTNFGTGGDQVGLPTNEIEGAPISNLLYCIYL